MQERVKTSFIPKASLNVARPTKPKGDPGALLNLVAALILVASIIASAGVFLFERILVQSIASKEASLERSREAFEPATIRELSRLDGRIESSQELLGKHIELSKLFDDLEKRTLATVSFTEFSYDSPTQNEVRLTMKGEATSFNAVALQSEEFSKSDIITDPIFSNVNINALGGINFDFTAIIDVARLRYTGASQSPVIPETPDDAAQTPSL